MIRRDWVPVLDNEVFKIIPAPDGQSIYVAGRFNQVNGATQQKVARLRVSDGTAMPFQATVDAVVTAMALQGNNLYIGGVFTRVQGQTRRFAALNKDTGALNTNMTIDVAGTHRGTGEGKIWSIEASNDGNHLAIVGSFSSVGGQPRNQVAKLNTNADGTATVSPWSTTWFQGTCGGFADYVRDVAYAPDSSYFVVVSTGGKGSGTAGTCDAAVRFNESETPNSNFDWIEYTGADSYYSVEVTGAAVYVGGHMRWSNNANGNDAAGGGAVETAGIAALDPSDGLPLLAWNPQRDRGRAVWQILATDNGLYVASDTDRIAGGIYRGRIAFFPLVGGASVPQPPRMTLPLVLDQFDPTGSAVTKRSFDGTTVGTPVAVTTNSLLSNVTAATYINGVLYSAHSNGTLQARAFDGTTFGSPATIDLRGLTSFATDLSNMTSMTWDRGRLYYTVEGSSNLYMRYFSTASNIVGAQRFTVTNSGSTFNNGYDDVDNAVLADNFIYYGDDDNGQLRRAPWTPTGGIDFNNDVTAASSNLNGLSWITTTLWALQGDVPNQPPAAVVTSKNCVGLRCTFDASGSSDSDGNVAGTSWNFGDGTGDTGAVVVHTYASPGTYDAAVTVTDNSGASSVAPAVVTVADVAPVANISVTCTDGTCQVDGSGSTDADGTIASYAWTFGDGGTADVATTQHNYTASGQYTIGLTITDNRGLTNSTSTNVDVTVPAGRGFIGSNGDITSTTTTTNTVTVPADTRAGDTVLLYATSNGPGGMTLDAPAGWTRVLDANTSSSRSAVWRRTATGTDAGTSVVVTTGALSKTDVVIATYRDLVVASSSGQTGYTTPTASAPAGAWVVSYWADKSATTTGWTAPAGVTVRHSNAGTGSGHISELLGDTNGAVPAGPVGGLTATAAGGAVPNAIAVTVVLTP